MLYFSKGVFVVSCICISIFIAVFVFFLWNFDQPPKAYYLADSLQEGMSIQEVQQILGPPNSDYGYAFAYTRSGAWGIYYVIFDEDEKLKEHYYDP